MIDLTRENCQDDVTAMSGSDIENLMDSIPEWEYNGKYLTMTKVFKNHYQAMAFVNAVAWISHQENHHPDIKVSYKDVKIDYWTHSVNGISRNDFICAAKVNNL